MGRNSVILKVFALLAFVLAAAPMVAQPTLTLNGAGTAKIGDVITFTTNNAWAGTSVTLGGPSHIRYLNTGGTEVGTRALVAGDIAGWAFAAGAITGGQVALVSDNDNAITQIELVIVTNAEGPITSTNRRNVDLYAPTIASSTVGDGARIGGSFTFVVQDIPQTDTDIVGANVRIQVNAANDGSGAWIDLTNQTPTAWVGGTGNNVTVDFDAIDANNDGYIEELIPAVTNGQVRVRIQATDNAGNVTTTTPATGVTIDALRPTILSITTMTTTSIRIIYSEEMQVASVSNVSNYAVSGGFTVLSTSLTTTTFPADTVTLNLSPGTPMNAASTPTVTVTNVRDVATNIVSAAAPNGTAATDGIKPTLIEARLNTYAGSNSVLLRFDEPVQGGLTAANFAVGAGDLTGITLVQNPGGLGNDYFQFDNNDAAVALVAGTTINPLATVLDLVGNTANATTATLILIPSVQSAAYSANNGAGQYTLSITFSKTINRTSFVNAVTAGHVRVSQQDGSTGQITVDNSRVLSITPATDAATYGLVLTPAADLEMVGLNGLGLIRLQFTTGTAVDGGGLAVIAATGADVTVVYTADASVPLLNGGTPPIQRKAVAITGTTVDVTFDDYMNQATVDGADFLLQPGAVAATSATVQADGFTVRLVFAGGVDVDAFDGNGVVNTLDILAAVSNNNGGVFAGSAALAINTDAAATSSVAQAAAPTPTTLVAATVAAASSPVFNFTITDAGADVAPAVLATNVTSIRLGIERQTGTFNPMDPAITWTLTGGDIVGSVTGVVADDADGPDAADANFFIVTFSGLTESIENSTAQNYVVNVQIGAASTATDGATFRVNRRVMNADIVSTGGSTFVAAAGATGTTMTYDVVATKLAFTIVDGGATGTFNTTAAFSTNKSVLNNPTAFGQWELRFVDANNKLDTGADGAGAQVTVSAVAGVAPSYAGTIDQPVSGQLNPTLGVADFVGGSLIRFATPSNDISLSFATVYNPGAAIAASTTTGTFDVRPDLNSTITGLGVNDGALDIDTGTPQTLEVFNLQDMGTADGLPTTVNSIAFTVAMGHLFAQTPPALGDFTWTLIADNDGVGVGAPSGAVTGVVAGATITFTGAPLINVANGVTGTIELRVSTAGITNSQVLDGTTFQITIANVGSFDADADIVHINNSSRVGTAAGTYEFSIDVIRSAFQIITQPTSPQVVGVAFTSVVDYVNARGSRDRNETSNVTVRRSDAGTPIVGGPLAAVQGRADFTTAITCAAPGNITAGGPALQFESALGIGIVPNITSNNFLLRNTDDANSTLTEFGTGVAVFSSVGGAQAVWVLQLSDTALSDGKDTLLTGLTMTVMVAGSTNPVNSFTWDIIHDGVGGATPISATSVVNGAPGTVSWTLSPGISTAAAVQDTAADRNITIRATPSANFTDKLNADGTTLTLNVTAATTDVAGTSLTFAPPLARTGAVTMQVDYTRLSFANGAVSPLTTPMTAGTAQDVTVWFTDANGNRDAGADGGGFPVTAARSDAGNFHPLPFPNLTRVVNASSGVASFTAGTSINLSAPASPNTDFFVNFTSTAEISPGVPLTTGNTSGQPLQSNVLRLNSETETSLSAGAGGEAATVSSVVAMPGVQLIDFTLTDAGNDDIDTTVSTFTVDMSASTVGAGAGNIQTVLQDFDFFIQAGLSLAADVTATVAGSVLTFNVGAPGAAVGGNTGITIADGGNATYVIRVRPKQIKFSTTVGARDGDILRASIQTGFFTTTAPTGRMTGATTITNGGGGCTLQVVASRIGWADATALPTQAIEAQPVRDGNNNPLAIEYTDANGNRDLGATDTISVHWRGVSDANMGTDVRANGVTNTLAATAGLATFTNFDFLSVSGNTVGFLGGHLYFIDAGAGILAGTGTYSLNTLNTGVINTDVLVLSNGTHGGAGTFNVRARDDLNSSYVKADVTSTLTVGSAAKTKVFEVIFTDQGTSDGKATLIKELRFDTVLSSAVQINATNFDWFVSDDNGATDTPATAKAVDRVSFVSAGTLFTIPDSGNGTPTNRTISLWAVPLTSAGNIVNKDAADNLTIGIQLNPGAGAGGNGVVLDSGAAAYNGTSLAAGQLTQVNGGTITVSVIADRVRFVSYNAGTASMPNQQLGLASANIQVEYRDAFGNRDLNKDGIGDAVTVARSDLGQGGTFNVTNGSLSPTNGIATFQLTFTAKRAGWTITNNANQITLGFSGTVGALPADADKDTSNAFNIQSDATSTITYVSNAAFLDDDAVLAPVFTINVNDVGTQDGLGTILDRLVINGSVTNGFALTDFTWELFNGVTTFAPTVAAGSLTFAPVGGNIVTVASNTSQALILRASTGSVTNSTTFDTSVISLSVAAADTRVEDATNSSTFAAFATVTNGGGTAVRVIADRLAVATLTRYAPDDFPGDGDTPNVPVGEERVNTPFAVHVYYENVNGNRDVSVTGDIVTVTRTDTGGVIQALSAATANGVAAFTGANAVNLNNPANVSGTLRLILTDDVGGATGVAPVQSNTFILRTYDDANSTITAVTEATEVRVMTGVGDGTNDPIDLWTLRLTDLDTSDPVPTLITRMDFSVALANNGGNDLTDFEWTLVRLASAYYPTSETFTGTPGVGTVSFTSLPTDPKGALVGAGDADLNTNGTPITADFVLRARVRTVLAGDPNKGTVANPHAVTDPTMIDGTTITVSLSSAVGPLTVWDDGNALNFEDSTSLNAALPPTSAPLAASTVPVIVVARRIRELPATMVTGTTQNSNNAFALGAEYIDVNNYRDRNVTGDTVSLYREDGDSTAMAVSDNGLPVVTDTFRGAGVIISGGTAVAANGVATFNVSLGYPGFLATDAGHRLFFVDDAAGNVNLYTTANGVGQPYTTGQFALSGQDEATIAAGFGAEALSVSSVAAGPAAVVDFQIIDQGNDALSTDIAQIVIAVGGTANHADGTWYLTGPDLTTLGFNGGTNRSVGVHAGLDSLGRNLYRFGTAGTPLSYTGTDAGRLPIRVGDNTGTVTGIQTETYQILFQPLTTGTTTTDNQFWTVEIANFDTDAAPGRARFSYDDVSGSGRLPSVTVDNTGVGGMRYDVVATKLSFGTITGPAGAPSGSTVAGTDFAPQPDFIATDVNGIRDLDYNSTITATLTTNPGSAAIVGTNPISFTAGQAQFSGLRLNVAATGYQFTYTSGLLPPLTSPLFNITAAAPAAIELSTQPGNTNAGLLLSTSPVIRFIDAFGNIATTAVNYQVFAAIQNVPVGGSTKLDDNSSVGTPTAPVEGVLLAEQEVQAPATSTTVTMNNLRINRAATGYTLRFRTVPALTTVDSAAFSILPNAPFALSVSSTFTDGEGASARPGVQAAGATAGAVFTTQPVVYLTDSLGNVRTNDNTTQVQATILTFGNYVGTNVVGYTNGTVAASIGEQATLLQGLNSRTVTVVSGVASFAGTQLQIDRAGQGYVLRYADLAAQHTAVNGSAFNVNPAVGALIQVEEQPANAVAATNIGGANTAVPSANIRVSIRDGLGNVRTNDDTTVISAAFGNNPSGGTATLSSPTTTSKTVTDGVVDFADLRINKAFPGYTLNFQSGGLATATSAPFNVTPGVAAAFQISQQPTTVSAGTAFFPAPAVTLYDAQGNIAVNDNTTVVRMVIQTKPGAGNLRKTSNLNVTVTEVDARAVNGVATFNAANPLGNAEATIDESGNGYSLSFSSVPAGIPAVTSAIFSVNPGTPDHLFLVPSSQPATTVAGAAIAPSPQLRVRDRFNNHVTSDNSTLVNVAIGAPDPSFGAATLGGTVSQAASAGVVTFNNLNLDKAFNAYLLAFTSTVTGTSTGTFNIVPAAATVIEIVDQPGNSTADLTIPQVGNAPSIRLKDNFGNIATNNSSSVVSVEIGTDPSGGTAVLSGTSSKAVTNGVATFAGLNINKARNGYTFSFTGSGGLTGATSATFNIVPGAPTHVVIATQPTNGTAGSPFGQPRVELYDQHSNLATNAAATLITASILSNPGSATFVGGSVTQISTTAGVANWGPLPPANQLQINKAAAGYTLRFEPPAVSGITGATSNAFTITHATASKIALTTHPNGATAGQSFNVQPVIEVRDAFDNRVVSDSISVVSVAFVLDGPGGGVGNPLGNANAILQGPPSQPVSSGIATFTGLRIDQAGTGFSLRFSSGILTTADSNSFNVNHAAASVLAVTTQPAGAFGGDEFITQPVVEIRDPFGNVATTSSLSVAGSLASDPSSGTSGFTGGPSLAANQGVVNFANLPLGNRFRINKAGTGYTLAFTASGLPTVNSAAFNVLVGPSASIHVTTEPDGFRATVDGNVQPLDPQPVLELRDRGGNKVVADSSTQVTASLGTNNPVSGTAILSGTTLRTAVAGVVTYDDLGISVAGDYSLLFTAGGLTAGESAVFSLVTGPLVLQTIALDDHDNNGQVSARDRLLFQWDEELQVASVPLVNTGNQLDIALGLTQTLGLDATAELTADGRGLWVRVGTGEQITSGVTTAKPTNIRNINGDLDVTPNPVVVGAATTDDFNPRLISLTVNGGSPSIVGAGSIVIEATYTDDQVNPTVSINAPGTNDVTSAVMAPVDAANPRVFRYTYAIGVANGTFFVDGQHSITVSIAGDAQGNQPVDDAGLPYLLDVDTMAPAFGALVIDDMDNCFRSGEVINLIANLGEVGLSVTADASAVNTAWTAPLGFDDGLDGTYTLSATNVTGTSIEGTHTITVTATDAAGNSSSAVVIVIIDDTAPIGTFSFNRPANAVPEGDLLISLSYNEDIYTAPILNITFDTNTTLNVAAAPMLGALPGRSFTYTLSVANGTVDVATLSVTGATDCAGNDGVLAGVSSINITGTAPVLVANAGPDQILETLAVVNLNGTASQGATAFSWSLTAGAPQTVTINGANTATPSFSATRAGDYVFRLEVSDGTNTASDTVTIRLPNFVPQISLDANVNTAASEVDNGQAKMGLSAGAFDANGDPLVTQWVLMSAPADGNLSIASPASLSSALNVSGAEMVGGVYSFELRVWDPIGIQTSTYESATLRFVVVSATRVAPAAHAGLAQTVTTGSLVTLSGNESSDPNAAVVQFPGLIYDWQLSVPVGSGAALSLADTVNPTFTPDVAGVYVAALRVQDVEGLWSGWDTVTITAVNATATSQAGLIRAETRVLGLLNVGQTITLDASLSPAASPLAVKSFRWTQLSGPETVVFSSATSGVQTFVPGTAGTYVFVVVPNDGQADGLPETVTVGVTAAGVTPPVASAAIVQSDDPNGDRQILFVPGMGVGLNPANTAIDLTAAGSSAGALGFQWRQTVGPTIGIINATSQVMSFVPRISRVYAFEVAVSYPDGVVSIATVEISVSTFHSTLNPSGNTVPVAVAGTGTGPIQGTAGSTISFSGAGSHPTVGAEGLIYTWVQVRGAPVVLVGANTPNPSFVPPVAGTYEFVLFVDDGFDISLGDPLTVQVGPFVQQPQDPGNFGSSGCSVAAGNTGGLLAILMALVGVVGFAAYRRRRA